VRHWSPGLTSEIFVLASYAMRVSPLRFDQNAQNWQPGPHPCRYDLWSAEICSCLFFHFLVVKQHHRNHLSKAWISALNFVPCLYCLLDIRDASQCVSPGIGVPKIIVRSVTMFLEAAESPRYPSVDPSSASRMTSQMAHMQTWIQVRDWR
jgi:hypothetical protein